MGEIFNYAQNKGIYSDHMWPFKDLQDQLKDEVSPPFNQVLNNLELV